MDQILPPGYSLPRLRQRLEEQLHKARAAELAKANEAERAQIEKEIQAEVEKQYGKDRFEHMRHGGVMWGV